MKYLSIFILFFSCTTFGQKLPYLESKPVHDFNKRGYKSLTHFITQVQNTFEFEDTLAFRQIFSEHSFACETNSEELLSELNHPDNRSYWQRLKSLFNEKLAEGGYFSDENFTIPYYTPTKFQYR